MIGRTNAGGIGGGSAAAGAIKSGTIVVSYPVGSKCTVTNGSTIYEALDDSGAAAFAVDAGTWTVHVGNLSKSVTVAAGAWVEVELGLWNGVLYDSGDEYAAFTGGWSGYDYKGSTLGTITKNSTNIRIATPSNGGNMAASHAKKVDLTPYSVLKVNVTTSPSSSNRANLFISQSESNRVNVAASADIGTGTGEKTLSLSGYSGEYYIGVGVWASTGASTALTFSRVWLE